MLLVVNRVSLCSYFAESESQTHYISLFVCICVCDCLLACVFICVCLHFFESVYVRLNPALGSFLIWEAGK